MWCAFWTTLASSDQSHNIKCSWNITFVLISICFWEQNQYSPRYEANMHILWADEDEHNISRTCQVMTLVWGCFHDVSTLAIWSTIWSAMRECFSSWGHPQTKVITWHVREILCSSSSVHNICTLASYLGEYCFCSQKHMLMRTNVMFHEHFMLWLWSEDAKVVQKAHRHASQTGKPQLKTCWITVGRSTNPFKIANRNGPFNTTFNSGMH